MMNRQFVPKPIRQVVRRIGASFGVMRDWDSEFRQAEARGGVQPAEWYDDVYSRSEEYKKPYQDSVYYFLWTVIADRILRSQASSVLDVGCGPGQFAHMLSGLGVTKYTGVDFSEVAVAHAQTIVPAFDFLVADALMSDCYTAREYDVLVCTEVLEHIEQDIELLERVPEGKRCICTVPNFPLVSHVRYFSSKEEVAERYAKLFADFSVCEYRGQRSESERFYLFEGVRR